MIRAKSRIARQRIDVGLPLSKIVNVRKEVFGELKVGFQLASAVHTMSRMRYADARHSTTWVRNSVMTDLFPQSDSHQTLNISSHRHGQVQSSYGTCQTSIRSLRNEGMKIKWEVSHGTLLRQSELVRML
jgi:hypothetical protein